jgi:hypothetical protein
MIRGLNLPGTTRTTSACCGTLLLYFICIQNIDCRINVVATATAIQVERFGVRVTIGPTDFSILRKAQTNSGARPMVWGPPPPGDKAAGTEANHSPLYSVEVKNEWSYISIPSARLHTVYTVQI